MRKTDDASPMKINEIARSLAVSEKSVRRYHIDGRLPTYKIGGRTSPILMDRADLERAKKQLKKKPGRK